MDRYQALKAKFCELGIDTSKPGFYDDPALLEAETGDDGLLAEYVEFVRLRPYDPAYLTRSRKVTRELCDFPDQKLREDGRLGACVNCSGALMRMLEKKGIWCFMVNGGLRLDFARATVLASLHFYPFRLRDDDNAFAAHYWLVAPPYRIVDVAVSRPPYPAGVQENLPSVVVAEECARGTLADIELVEPALVQLMLREAGRLPTPSDLESQTPGYQDCGEKVGILEVATATAAWTYRFCGILFPAEPLEGFTGIRLCGRTPPDLFADFRES